MRTDLHCGYVVQLHKLQSADHGKILYYMTTTLERGWPVKTVNDRVRYSPLSVWVFYLVSWLRMVGETCNVVLRHAESITSREQGGTQVDKSHG